jgi:ketosteroid isomerase-like protein
MTPQTVAEAYLDAWSRKDAPAIAALVAAGVTFKGPMAQTEGVAPFMAAVGAMFPLLRRIERRALFVTDASVLAVCDFVCAEPIGACRTAEMLSIEDGRIVASEVFFDARPFEALARARCAP